MRPKLKLIRSDSPEVIEQPVFRWSALWKDRRAVLFLAAWGLFLTLFSPAWFLDSDVSGRAEITQSALSAALLAFVYVPLLGTLWFYLLWTWLQTWGISRRESAYASAAYFVAGPAFYYSTQSVQEEALVATLGLTALTLAKQSSDYFFQRKNEVFLCGLFAGLSLIVQANSVFYLLPIFGLAIDAYRKDSSRLRASLGNTRYALAGIAIPFALNLVMNYFRFGSVMPSAIALGSPQWSLALGFLVGLGKGLFVVSPALLLCFFGAREAFEKNKAFGWSVASAIVLSCVFHACIPNGLDETEGWSVRYLIHLSTLLVLPAYYGFKRAQDSDMTKAVASILLAVGMFFASLSVMAPNSLEYLQNAGEGKSPNQLTLSWTDGQLARRATNLSLRLSGEPIEAGYDVNAEAIVKMQNEYMPNLWPWVLSKKFPQHALWIWIAWIGMLTASVRIIWFLNLPKPVHKLTAL